jgi:DNA-binding NarL/FixJ family response regulator
LETPFPGTRLAGCVSLIKVRAMTQTRIRDLTADDLKLFAETIALLERMDSTSNVRKEIFSNVVKLARADFAASYVWDPGAGRFNNGLVHNMGDENIRGYEEWHQFHDQLTFKLRARRTATLVEEVTPYPTLYKTAFFNDFLSRDGLDHGINIFLFDRDRDLGDFRLWRAKRSAAFGEREVHLLNTLAPFIERAIVRSEKRSFILTGRERQVAELVARGCRDIDIARLLGIGFATVRTHLNNSMEKNRWANRAELAAAISQSMSRSIS